MSFSDFIDERMLISHDVLGKKEMKIKVLELSDETPPSQWKLGDRVKVNKILITIKHLGTQEIEEGELDIEAVEKELVEKVGMDEGGIFEHVTTMIIHGAPITFYCSDGCWQDFYTPEEMFYRIAERPEELTQLVLMIGKAQERLGELKAAVELRQGALSTASMEV